MLAFKAVVPTETVKLDEVKVQRQLKAFGLDVVTTMQDYPPAKPWKNKPPRTGPRRGGRRTGSYGRSWGMRVGRGAVVIASGLTRRPLKYSGYVGGYRGQVVNARKAQYQARVMRKRGWPSTSDVVDKLWRKHLPKIKRVLQAI